jgi:hypothetical protein
MKNFTLLFSIVLSAILLPAGCSEPPDEVIPTPEKVKVSGVSLNDTEIVLTVGDKSTLRAGVIPSDATTKTLKWSSKSPSIVSVDEDSGEIVANKAGKTTVTVRTVEGGYSESCSVTVNAGDIAVTSLVLSDETTTVAAEDQKTFTFKISPAAATNKRVTWSSSDPTVATVDASGKMTALKSGTTEIRVSSQEGISASCRVTVTPPDPDNLLRTVHIPDPVFLDYCRSQMELWDTNKDGKLYADEAAAVKSIDVANAYGNAIYSLKGIEYFTGITYLDCSLNNLTSLDVSRCTRLTELYCNNNYRLSSLNVSGYTMLTTLNCSSCALAELDVTRCTRLAYLMCDYNELSSLDLSMCTNLTTLQIDGNKFSSIDLSKNRSLKGLTCKNNSLASIDLSACTRLATLDCYGNELSSLDLSQNSELIFLSCEMNQLSSLDISKNAEMESLICHGNQLVSIGVGEENEKLTRIVSSSNRLNSEALNTMFRELPFSGTISIHNNPGTTMCDISIAVNKNWIVEKD